MKIPNDFPPEELDLAKAIQNEKSLLEKATVPILTISATYRKELADKYHTIVHTPSDVIFSRAHYSMAEAVRQTAHEMQLSTYMCDPTNYVSHKEWLKVEITETTGQLMARHRLLKWLKDKIDTKARNKLPINKAVTLPTQYLIEKISMPIVSLHYEIGNILVKLGKKVVQVVTDPHVRPQYLECLPTNKIVYCLFDEETKKYFMTEAKKQKKQISDQQLIVTGPPVDPRISKSGLIEKKLEKNKPINLGVCTGGLGTNLSEIKKVLEILKPYLKSPEKVRLFLYAGTHRDFRNFFEDFAQKNNIRIGNIDQTSARIRILYEDSIIDANKNLIRHMFPWAHGVITKPSGDMAYDAAAAGCFLLFLEPWGEWEENIQRRFVKRQIGFDLDIKKDYQDLKSLLNLERNQKLVSALQNSHHFSLKCNQGTKNILKVQQKFPF